MALLAARNQASVRGHDAPPGHPGAVSPECRTDGTSGARTANFGRHLAVTHDVARFKRTNQIQDRRLELAQLERLIVVTHDGTSATTSIASGKPLTWTGPIGMASVFTIMADTNSLGASSWPGWARSAKREARFTIEPM